MLKHNKTALSPREQHILRLYSPNELLTDILSRHKESYEAWNQDAKDYAKKIKKTISAIEKFIKIYNKLDC